MHVWVRRTLIATLACIALWTDAHAETWPSKPIRWIVPFPAGGPADILSRVLAERLAEPLGQAVVVDNRAGASGIIGTEMGVRAAPDGYTFIYGIASTITTNQLVVTMTYDPAKELLPVSLLTRGFFLLVVRPDLPARTLQDFIALAKAQPGKLNYGSWGNGSGTHLAMELFKRRVGVDITHVPYKGSAPVLNDLMSNQLDVTFETTNPAVNFVRAGKIRAIAMSAPERNAALPDLPAIAELYPGFEVPTWGAVLAPLGTPREIVDRMSREIGKVMQAQDVQAKFRDLGSEPVGSPPNVLAERIARDTAMWRKVIEETGIKAD
jgi:tripartite-type tricarboxylate transporter receptor subunit TctC